MLTSFAVQVLSLIAATVYCDEHQPYIVKPVHYLGQVQLDGKGLCSGFFNLEGEFLCPKSCVNQSSNGLRLLKAGADGGSSSGPVVSSEQKSIAGVHESKYLYSKVISGLGVGNLLPLEFDSPSQRTAGQNKTNYFTVAHFEGRRAKETKFVQASQKACYDAFKKVKRGKGNRSQMSSASFDNTYFCATPKREVVLKKNDMGAPAFFRNHPSPVIAGVYHRLIKGDRPYHYFYKAGDKKW